ncbi:hypothetical protein ACJJTC_017940 [Scirpophaga incertulas]
MAKIAKCTCVNFPDSFCFICGSFTTCAQRRRRVPPVAMDIVSEASLDTASSFVPSYDDRSSEPHLIEQPELNDLVRDLNLSKQHAELLGSRLQQWNLLAKDTKIKFHQDILTMVQRYQC